MENKKLTWSQQICSVQNSKCELVLELLLLKLLKSAASNELMFKFKESYFGDVFHFNLFNPKRYAGQLLLIGLRHMALNNDSALM